MAVCYRHPGRETGVSCANCGRPICTDCMTSTSVGMRCPECSKATTKVKRVSSMSYDRPVVTIALIAINVLVFIGVSSTTGSIGRAGGSLEQQFALLGAGRFDAFGPLQGVAEGQWYRLFTGAFLHAGLLHIGFNMYILWFLGNQLEPSLGSVRFAALYIASILTGSFGALLLAPNALTVGASGAVFGLMGATFVIQRARGIDPMQSGIGVLILLNLGISFVLPGISIGGHIGGLVGGAASGWLIEQAGARRLKPLVAICVGACAVIGVLGIVGSLLVANGSGIDVGLFSTLLSRL